MSVKEPHGDPLPDEDAAAEPQSGTQVGNPDHEPDDQDDRAVPLDDPALPELPLDQGGERRDGLIPPDDGPSGAG